MIAEMMLGRSDAPCSPDAAVVIAAQPTASSTCGKEVDTEHGCRRLDIHRHRDLVEPDRTEDATAECSVSSGESFHNILDISSKITSSKRGILRAESKISEPQEIPAHPRSRKVRFSTIVIRDYDIILGDHPCCSYGPPLTIDWEYHQHDPLEVDVYEFENALSRRTLRGMMLNYYQRKYLLQDYTELDFKSVVGEIKRIKSNRFITKKLSRYQTVEAALESACRKVKRILR